MNILPQPDFPAKEYREVRRDCQLHFSGLTVPKGSRRIVKEFDSVNLLNGLFFLHSDHWG
jgi:hypothetical protein